MEHIRGLMDFIQRSPTAFHAADAIAEMLSAAGFEPLNEGDVWRLEPGRGYYVTRNQSSLMAFRLPENGADHFQIVASHTDSPAFKLKPASRRDSAGYAVLNVEKYGGMIMSTWFDRPLSVAGRVLVRTTEGLEARRVNIDRDIALIPNMPIHFNRQVNDGVKLNPQVDMLPIVGPAGTDILPLLASAAGVEPENIVGGDLFLVNRDAPRLWGANSEYIAAPRLDDLMCAYASAVALIDAKPSRHVDVLCALDNEEVGSRTRQGADSTLLAEILRRIAVALGQEVEPMLARSFMVSADNAHAVHPNHPEQYDAENRVAMNGGVVVKFNASQKYCSDAVSQAVFEAICQRAGVPTQRFANRSDIPGGSTLGNISGAHASMISVDVGLPQLAMHSANECAGVHDLEYMIRALQSFHETEINIVCDGQIKFQ